MNRKWLDGSLCCSYFEGGSILGYAMNQGDGQWAVFDGMKGERMHPHVYDDLAEAKQVIVDYWTILEASGKLNTAQAG